MSSTASALRPMPASAGSLSLQSSRFSTHDLPRSTQALAWRGRVGHVVDAPPSAAQMTQGFAAHIDRYAVGPLSFTDCYTDAMTLERSVARVSTDARTDYAFHVFKEGSVGQISGTPSKRGVADASSKIVAFDMSEPFHVERQHCRALTLFVPREMIEAVAPNSESMHGRALKHDEAFTALLLDHVSAIGRNIAQLNTAAAFEVMRAAGELLIAGFRGTARFNESDRAALQTAVMGQVRRYIEANLHRNDLTPTTVVVALQLKRATIYRWFEQEGGLGSYIRHRRLRMAASELVRFPKLPVVEIAYGLGFKSASDFNRAFRRAFQMSPQDMRAKALDLQVM